MTRSNLKASIPNHPPATPPCGLNPTATCRVKSETPHYVPTSGHAAGPCQWPETSGWRCQPKRFRAKPLSGRPHKGKATAPERREPMEPLESPPSAPHPRTDRAQPSPHRRPPARHTNGNGAKRGNGLVRINHALGPALRAAAHWRAAACDLERLEREHQRRRTAIIARQQRAGVQLAAFMTQTGANRRWLTSLLDLPEHAAVTTDKARHGDA